LNDTTSFLLPNYSASTITKNYLEPDNNTIRPQKENSSASSTNNDANEEDLDDPNEGDHDEPIVDNNTARTKDEDSSSYA